MKSKSKSQLLKWAKRNLHMDKMCPKKHLLLQKLSMIDPSRNSLLLCQRGKNIQIPMKKCLSTPIKILWLSLRDRWLSKILKTHLLVRIKEHNRNLCTQKKRKNWLWFSAQKDVADSLVLRPLQNMKKYVKKCFNLRERLSTQLLIGKLMFKTSKCPLLLHQSSRKK